MCRDVRDISPILKEIFPSAEMASYLARCPFSDDIPCHRCYVFDDASPEKLPLRREDIRDAIAYAAIPLNRKRDLFLQLASGKDTAYFRLQAAEIEAAIRGMQPKSGEFFHLKGCYYIDEGRAEEDCLEPYLTWEHIWECIREYLGYFDAKEKELVWFHVEKWSPDGNGRLKNDYDYMVLGTEVCYFSSSRREQPDFSIYNDVNLPVPFYAGNIVTIDCRPFAPVSHAVILEVGDNMDCCCLQALYHNSDGTWDIGAVKHGHVLPNRHSTWFSPLYRLASFHGQLPEEERLLEQVSRHINGEEERGSALWNYIFNLKNNKRKWTVTEEQILSYMANSG